MNGGRILFRGRLERPRYRFDVELSLPLHGISGVFGASGAGKTTLLRCLAGLERPVGGLVKVGDETWQDDDAGVFRPVEERRIGYVFQEPRLFRHLDVRANLDYGTRRSAAGAAGPGFDAVVEMLGIGALLERRPDGLSGGEGQRVAIARALLTSPALVLMDEPMASLDAGRKEEILPFLDRLHAELDTPVVYVSHNIEEISRLCDHLLVLDEGSVAANDDLQTVLLDLDSKVLSGEDAGAVIAGHIAEYDAAYDLTSIAFEGGRFRVPGRHGEPGQALRLRVRASDVSLCRERPADTTILNLLDATVTAIEEGGGATLLLRLDVGGAGLLARVTRRSREELGLEVGDALTAQVKAVAIRGH